MSKMCVVRSFRLYALSIHREAIRGLFLALLRGCSMLMHWMVLCAPWPCALVESI